MDEDEDETQTVQMEVSHNEHQNISIDELRRMKKPGLVLQDAERSSRMVDGFNDYDKGISSDGSSSKLRGFKNAIQPVSSIPLRS